MLVHFRVLLLQLLLHVSITNNNAIADPGLYYLLLIVCVNLLTTKTISYLLSVLFGSSLLNFDILSVIGLNFNETFVGDLAKDFMALKGDSTKKSN